VDEGVPIEEVMEVTDEIVAAVSALMFQLSPRRAAPDAEVLSGGG
jgi:hypothetical protein